jgi:hypothetical protein
MGWANVRLSVFQLSLLINHGILFDSTFDRKRDRDLAFKALNDPLTAITHQLAARSQSSSSSSKPQPKHLLPRPPRSNARPSNHREALPAPAPAPPQSTLTSRLTRESAERERALALIARKKRELQGSETPSTVHGDDYGGYTDVFNRREVEEAHRGWGRSGRDHRERERDLRNRRW